MLCFHSHSSGLAPLTPLPQSLKLSQSRPFHPAGLTLDSLSISPASPLSPRSSLHLPSPHSPHPTPLASPQATRRSSISPPTHSH
ncbi:hypothetical protein E2C01_068204 [Portunus trituberculatus]|uniref:Uncharacterized protein n=1 Tax=Portunus trituberculatus TaxID=210409 RepID=A0A5B7HZF3_PORTR|nr:hypothetical protein [Portunus trituberculatus]